MKEFALLFRQPGFDYSNLSADEMAVLRKKWADWAAVIVAEGRLVNNGIRLDTPGKVLKAGGILTDGPFVEVREILGSFVVILAESLDDATTVAHGCPVLDRGGSVEIRPVLN
ncbi:YciI family protein [Chitinophaga sp. 22321]|uniref:Transcription initiation protein n=1 Tax=Chitinophaga hostae TaxID=2831022 RepID=A0ABS5JAZ4_9BACT|nr:YciI family protein [Chitinophaga hostae]MBS0031757.1 transcription initiation protein [Chitinophaga hostae]